MSKEIVGVDNIESSRQFNRQMVIKFTSLAVRRISLGLGRGHEERSILPKAGILDTTRDHDVGSVLDQLDPLCDST